MRNVSRLQLLESHVIRLQACDRCPRMLKPVVSGGPILSEVILVGQAPGVKEPIARKPFAWTAGKTLFGWFGKYCGVHEEQFRASIYMAAVCRCFPGKNNAGGDRVPDSQEIKNCSGWLQNEIEILLPSLIIPVGKLAIAQFLPIEKLDQMIGKKFEVTLKGQSCDIIPLPHPSGASPWHRMEPGKTLLEQAMKRICLHAAFQKSIGREPTLT